MEIPDKKMTTTKRILGRQTMISLGFYLGIAVLAILVWRLTVYINNLPYVLGPTDEKALSKAWDAYAAVNTLLTTLGTGLLAGLGLFLTSKPRQHHPMRELWPAVVSALCVCLSLYWGYISSQNLEWAIEYSVGTLDLYKIQVPRELQFLMILLGVVFFADFVRRDRTTVN
jgi:hypothetical protein